MAVLNNTLVNGILRLNGDLLASGLIDVSGGTLKGRIINLPTAAGGSTYGAGTDGQIVVSNGTHAYWVTPSTATITPVSASGTETVLKGVKATSTDKAYKSIVFNTSNFLTDITFNTATPFTGISTTKPSFSGTQGSVSVTGTPNGSVTLTLNDSAVDSNKDVQVVTGVSNGAPTLNDASSDGASVVISVTQTKGDYTPSGNITLSANGTSTGGALHVQSLNTTSITRVTGITGTPGTSGSGRSSRRTLTISASTSSQTICTGGTSQYLHATFSGSKTNDLVTNVASDSKYLHTNVSATKKYLHAAFGGSSTTSTGNFTPSGTVTLSADNFTTTSVLASVATKPASAAHTSIKDADSVKIDAVTGVGANGTTSAVTGLTNGTSFTVLKSTK